MLWTDAGSREFIAEHYPWFLDNFDDYRYSIQRADAIRYFVLHHYGGVYLDLDVGCLRPLDQLLTFPVILPKTIPVGVSNDLMFAERGHPFLAQTIHNLITFDHSWVLNYPTVMFSTGPMFLSAQYGLYTASHPPTPEHPGGEVRILPKSLYGKNAKPEEAPHSFFSHFYGSSWHADDAAFIGFLGKWGKGLMWVGLVVLIVGLRRILSQNKRRKYSLRRIGNYDVLLPRWTQRNGRWNIDLGWLSIPSPGTFTQPPSPNEGPPTEEENIELLPFDVRPGSPTTSEISASTEGFFNGHGSSAHPLFDTVRRARSRFVSLTGSQEREEVPRTPFRRRSRQRSVLFFLPAFLTQSSDAESATYRNSPPVPTMQPPPLPRSNSMPPGKRLSHPDDPELAGHRGDSISPIDSGVQSHRTLHRPAYENRSSSYPASPQSSSLVDLGSISRT